MGEDDRYVFILQNSNSESPGTEVIIHGKERAARFFQYASNIYAVYPDEFGALKKDKIVSWLEFLSGDVPKDKERRERR